VPKPKSIPLDSLLIDYENPRLEGLLADQRAAVCAVAVNQGSKLVALARDVLENGLDPSSSLMVTPFEEDARYYVVLEGNRRLAALKILKEPGLISGAVDDAIVSRFRRLSSRYRESAHGAECIVFDDRAAAAHWIELRHTGENEGAGIVRWGGKETARFRQRIGQKAPHLQVLDALEARGDIDKETSHAVPVTSLKRLVGDPDVRTKLGIDLRSGVVGTRAADDSAVAKGLKRVVEDIASGRVPVKKIYTKQDRKKYVDSLPPQDLPDVSTLTGEWRALGSPPSPEHQKAPSRKSKPAAPSKKRQTLVPSALSLSISQTRINRIYRELKKLKLHEYTNAVSVLFRVFLELSVDAYISANQTGMSQTASLGKKLLHVGEALKASGKMDDQQLKPVARAAQKDSLLASTVTTMHQYVHNQYVHPAPADLVAAWDSLQPFIEAVWS
jgi:hypothetical protein